ncbi:MAG TPA: hypothetical protein VHB72_04615 [Candidatus Saccharimonadales bacterium]|nr:hypothetical protein [Candidatus Saccharimonadales bacterium]
MPEEIQSSSMSPAELVEMFSGPLQEAQVGVERATDTRERAVSMLQAAEVRLERTTASETAAKERLDSLRSAGHAALASITEAPASETLEAQMVLDGRDRGEFFDLMNDVDALNHYAYTEQHPIVITTGVRDRKPALSVLELRKRPDLSEPDVAGVHRSKRGNVHSLQLAIRDIFTSIYLAEGALDADSIRRTPRFGSGRSTVEVGAFEAPGAPVDQLGFADTAQEAEALFKFAEENKSLLPQAVIYGTEAVQAFVAALASRYEGARVPFFGIFKELGVPYSGEGLAKGSEAATKAQGDFGKEVQQLVRSVIIYGDNLRQATVDASHWVVSSDMQEFLEVSDPLVAGSVRAEFIDSMVASVIDGKVTVDGVSNEISLDQAWMQVWRIMDEKGFTSLSEKMLDDFYGVLNKAQIRHAVIQKRLSNPAKRTKRSQQRALERAHHEEQATILRLTGLTGERGVL